jgi:uncharacterized protein YndB with AHSA1/START domain
MDLDPELDLILTRDIKAPPEVLWKCWTMPEHLVQWFVPRPHRVTACRLDLRPGGACNTTFDIDGTEMQNNGVYLEVVPNERLVFTDTYTEGWKPSPDPFMTAIITFEDLGDGSTRYTAVARHRSKEAAETHREMGFHDGWGTVATQLEGYAQEHLMADRVMTISRLIAAPADVVWRCWTDPEILPRWFGPEGYSCTTKEIDLREGGLWRFDMTGPDGKVWANRHRFTLHRAPEQIEFLLDDDTDGAAMHVTVILQAEGAGTRVTQTVLFPDASSRQGALDFGADRLGQTTLAKLARVAEAL